MTFLGNLFVGSCVLFLVGAFFALMVYLTVALPPEIGLLVVGGTIFVVLAAAIGESIRDG